MFLVKYCYVLESDFDKLGKTTLKIYDVLLQSSKLHVLKKQISTFIFLFISIFAKK
jgi:hypothetical protein